MRRILSITTAASTAAFLWAGFITSSSAATVTQNLTVNAAITASCSINSLPTLNFGNIPNTTIVTNATTSIDITCTNTTPYNIGLDKGTGTGATVATRVMTGPSSATLTYSLFQDTLHTTVWGDKIGTDTVAGTGTGAPASITIYGQVFAQASTPAAGAYTDTVVATLTY